MTGIFGGTFDPIHVGHIHLALQIRERLHLDEVWFLVTPQNPWKQNNDLLDDNQRFALVSHAVAKIDGLIASDYEFHLEKPSYSYLTLRHLREDFPERDFLLIIGADNWVKFDKWAHHEEILANHHIAVYPREGFDISLDSLPENVHFIDTRLCRVSSTQIRERIKKGETIDNLVPPDVIPEIYNLYSFKLNP